MLRGNWGFEQWHTYTCSGHPGGQGHPGTVCSCVLCHRQKCGGDQVVMATVSLGCGEGVLGGVRRGGSTFLYTPQVPGPLSVLLT